MANSDMALLTEKRLKEMEAEMNRYEIIFGKNYAVSTYISYATYQPQLLRTLNSSQELIFQYTTVFLKSFSYLSPAHLIIKRH